VTRPQAIQGEEPPAIHPNTPTDAETSTMFLHVRHESERRIAHFTFRPSPLLLNFRMRLHPFAPVSFGSFT
jgi:hypothetical protein